MVSHELQQSFFRNGLALQKSAAGVIPIRFTGKQLAEYEQNPVFGIRSRCPAGVCLDVMTDATQLVLEVEILNWVRPYGYFDLFVGDRFVRSVGDSDATTRNRHYTFELHDGLNGDTPAMQRVTIYLPHNVEFAIRCLSRVGGTALEAVPAPAAKNLLCLGDSITQGMDAVHPSHTYPVKLARALGMNLLNQGVGGYHYDVRSLDDNLAYDPELITIAYGTNDWGRRSSLDEFAGYVTDYLSKMVLMFPSARIFVITPLWRRDVSDAKTMGTFEQLTETIVRSCRDFSSIRCLHGTELFDHDPGLYADQVHPNEDAFHIMAGNLASLLKV